MKDKELFNFLIERATKTVLEELREYNYTNSDIKIAIYKHIEKKVVRNRNKRAPIARPVLIVSDSSDNE